MIWRDVELLNKLDALENCVKESKKCFLSLSKRKCIFIVSGRVSHDAVLIKDAHKVASVLVNATNNFRMCQFGC
jgi:hypothetical protein